MALNLRPIILPVAALLIYAAPQDGIRPRAAASDYSAHETVAGVTVAVSAISPDQIRKLFATDLNKAGYLVFEVAIYPDPAKPVDVDAGDFMLKIGSDGSIIRAASPQAIASVLRQKNAPSTKTAGNSNVYTSTEVGYESGAYDPVTGRRTHGWYTSSGVGIGSTPPNSPPPPGASDRDQWAFERELEDKALPAGKASQPVAGYLYFPKSGAKNRTTAFQLNWYSDSAKVSVSVPPPPKP